MRLKKKNTDDARDAGHSTPPPVAGGGGARASAQHRHHEGATVEPTTPAHDRWCVRQTAARVDSERCAVTGANAVYGTVSGGETPSHGPNPKARRF
jgi:hypothetical protein